MEYSFDTDQFLNVGGSYFDYIPNDSSGATSPDVRSSDKAEGGLKERS